MQHWQTNQDSLAQGNGLGPNTCCKRIGCTEGKKQAKRRFVTQLSGDGCTLGCWATHNMPFEPPAAALIPGAPPCTHRHHWPQSQTQTAHTETPHSTVLSTSVHSHGPSHAGYSGLLLQAVTRTPRQGGCATLPAPRLCAAQCVNQKLTPNAAATQQNRTGSRAGGDQYIFVQAIARTKPESHQHLPKAPVTTSQRYCNQQEHQGNKHCVVWAGWVSQRQQPVSCVCQPCSPLA